MYNVHISPISIVQCFHDDQGLSTSTQVITTGFRHWQIFTHHSWVTYLEEYHEDGLVERVPGPGVLHLLHDIRELDEHVPLGHPPQHSLEGDLPGAVQDPRHDVELHRPLVLLQLPGRVLVHVFNI